MNQLPHNKLAMNDRIQKLIPNFKIIVTRFIWKKVEMPVGSLTAKYV